MRLMSVAVVAVSLAAVSSCRSDRSVVTGDSAAPTTTAAISADPDASVTDSAGETQTSAPIELEPVELTAQAGSRSANNALAIGKYQVDGYTAIDEAAFFAEYQNEPLPEVQPHEVRLGLLRTADVARAPSLRELDGEQDDRCVVALHG